VENGYSARLGSAAGSSYGLLQETAEVQNQWMNREVVKRNQSAGMKTAMNKYRASRMNVKLADVYLSKKLAEVSVKKGAGKAAKAKVDAKKTGTKGKK
jgi:pyruvoyl-dependent arginine decarboxylase (PvlArgDC)